VKGALVTGAAQRIGRCIAEALVADGWHVAGHHHTAADTVRAITEAGGQATAVQADLSDPDACCDLIQTAGNITAGLSCLINNASVFVEDRIGDVEAAAFDGIMAVNLRAPVLLS